VPVIAEPVATAEIPADAETVLAPSAGEQTSQVLKTTDSPVGQVLGTTAARAHGIAGASAPPQSPETATDVTTNEASAGEPATRIDVNSGSATQHPKHDLLPGQDGNGWPDGVERNPAPSDRTVQTADAFNALIARGEQDHGVAEAPPSTWRPLVDRLAEEISSHLRIGKNEAVLQLDPPELGRIKIDLRMEDGRLHARIVAEGQDSKALIEAHLPDLRQALVAGKIEVADVRISQGNWSGAGDLGQGLQQQQRGRQETGPGFDTAATGSQEGKERRPQTSPRESGRVSMWA
jgi:flagellar hook-length control protein FliK